MTGTYTPSLRMPAIRLALTSFLLVLALAAHLWVGLIVLLALATTSWIVALASTSRQRVTLGEGWLEARDLRGPVRYEAGHAVWTRRTMPGKDLPGFVGLVDEQGRRRVISLGDHEQDAAWSVYRAVSRTFPEAPRGTRRATSDLLAKGPAWQDPQPR